MGSSPAAAATPGSIFGELARIIRPLQCGKVQSLVCVGARVAMFTSRWTNNIKRSYHLGGRRQDAAGSRPFKFQMFGIGNLGKLEHVAKLTSRGSCPRTAPPGARRKALVTADAPAPGGAAPFAATRRESQFRNVLVEE